MNKCVECNLLGILELLGPEPAETFNHLKYPGFTPLTGSEPPPRITLLHFFCVFVFPDCFFRSYTLLRLQQGI